jgi:hypothetical protein
MCATFLNKKIRFNERILNYLVLKLFTQFSKILVE